VTALERRLPQRLVDLVANRVKRCLEILGEQPTKVGSVPPDAYHERLTEIVEATSPQKLEPAGGPPLIRQAVNALSDAAATDPRDLTLVRERIVELGAGALRVVRAIAEAEPPPGFANPTTAMIDDYAPNIANLPIATDDPVARFVNEMVKAADRYADADPKSIYGSAQERLRALFRVVGLAGRALALPCRPSSGRLPPMPG
jgi:hypothetical protein